MPVLVIWVQSCPLWYVWMCVCMSFVKYNNTILGEGKVAQLPFLILFAVYVIDQWIKYVQTKDRQYTLCEKTQLSLWRRWERWKVKMIVVSVLFMGYMPVDKTFDVRREMLEKDDTLKHRTQLVLQNIFWRRVFRTSSDVSCVGLSCLSIRYLCIDTVVFVGLARWHCYLLHNVMLGWASIWQLVAWSKLLVVLLVIYMCWFMVIFTLVSQRPTVDCLVVTLKSIPGELAWPS